MYSDLYSAKRLDFVNDVPALMSPEDFIPAVKKENSKAFDISLRDTAASDRAVHNSQAPNAEWSDEPPFESKMENGIICIWLRPANMQY